MAYCFIIICPIKMAITWDRWNRISLNLIFMWFWGNHGIHRFWETLQVIGEIDAGKRNDWGQCLHDPISTPAKLNNKTFHEQTMLRPSSQVACKIKLSPFGSEMGLLIKIKRNFKGKMSNKCIFFEAGSTFCGDQQFSLVLGIGISRSKIGWLQSVPGSWEDWQTTGIDSWSRTLCKCCRLKVHQQLRANLWDWQRCKEEVTESP